MYQSFEVKNYRCFDQLTLAPLERINLLAGKNNVGKTALLEALWLHQGYHNPELAVRVDVFRGLERFRIDEFMWDLFANFSPEQAIELSSRDERNKTRLLKISLREKRNSRTSLRKKDRSPERIIASTETLIQQSLIPKHELVFEYTLANKKPVYGFAYIEDREVHYEPPAGARGPNAIFLTARNRENPEELAGRFSDVAVNKRLEEIIRVLQIIQPDLKDLSVQYQHGAPIIYGDVGKSRLLPLPLMGDGIGRLLSIALAISQAENGLVLIDEVENGLYYAVIVQVWQAMARLARDFNVQVFATTHSYECIQAAHEAFVKEPVYDFRLHRLEEYQGHIQAVSYDQETLGAALESGWEVR